jgi:F420-0:gamma-glutamyl ligase-like protein
MRTKEQCLADLSKYGPLDVQYQAARAELDVLMAQEHLALLQKTRENLYQVLAEMSSGIVAFRQVVDRAAADGDKTARLLVRWTKVLSFATVGLVMATGVLVYATFKGR